MLCLAAILAILLHGSLGRELEGLNAQKRLAEGFVDALRDTSYLGTGVVRRWSGAPSPELRPELEALAASRADLSRRLADLRETGVSAKALLPLERALKASDLLHRYEQEVVHNGDRRRTW